MCSLGIQLDQFDWVSHDNSQRQYNLEIYKGLELFWSVQDLISTGVIAAYHANHWDTGTQKGQSPYVVKSTYHHLTHMKNSHTLFYWFIKQN